MELESLPDPEDCDREWEAYLALVSGKETASVSPPTNTTSTLHSCVHGMVSASSSTRSTASLHAPSSAISTTTTAAPASASTSTRDSSPATKDDLSPEARLIYNYIMGNSDEFASRDGLSPGARSYYDSLVSGSAPPAAATTDVYTNVLVSTELDVVHDAVEDLAVPTPSTCSTICRAGDTPASSTTVSTMLTSPPEIEDIHDAINNDSTHLAVSTLTTCSTDCPSRVAISAVSTLIPSATPKLSTASGGIVPELAAPEPRDTALGMDVTGDTAPLAAVCLQSGSDHSISGGDHMSMFLILWSPPTSFNMTPGNLPSPLHVSLDVLQQFKWSPITCSTIRSGRSTNAPPSLLAEGYKVYEVPTATEIVPWPPPIWTRAKPPLIRGQDLFQHAQQKCGNDFIVKDSQGTWNANWIELREARHPFERMKVVKLKPPWPSYIGLCLNLPMAATNSAIVNNMHCKGLADPVESVRATSRCSVVVYSSTLQEERRQVLLRMPGQSFRYHWEAAYLMKPCSAILRGNTHYSEQMQWLFSHSQLQFQFCTAFQYCCDPREPIYSCENFQWTIVRSLSYPFSQSISWSFSCPPWEDGLLPCSTRRAFLSSFEKFQWEIARLLNMSLVEGNPWTCLGVFAGGPDIPIFLWVQFAVKTSTIPQAELVCNIMFQLQPLPCWELFSFKTAVTSCLHGASHILASSRLILEGIYSSSCHYLEVHIWDTLSTRLSTPPDMLAGKFLLLLGQYSSCNQFVARSTTNLGSELFEWKIPWYSGPCRAIFLSNWLQMQPVGGHSEFPGAFVFSLEVINTIDSVLVIKHVLGMFTLVLQYLEVGNYLAVTMLLLSSRLSQEDDNFTCTKRVLISWDPGGLTSVLAATAGVNWKSTKQPFLHLDMGPRWIYATSA